MTFLNKSDVAQKLSVIILSAGAFALALPAQAKSICPQDYPSYKSYVDALSQKNERCHSLIRKGITSGAEYRSAGCDQKSSCSRYDREAKPEQTSKVVETYNIDLLQIVHTKRESEACVAGAIHSFQLQGVIGPDSTFAMKRLLERNVPCTAADGSTVTAPIVYLNSGGGLLNDGYALGREFRRLGISVAIGAKKQCASSCAVTFLGGKKRVVADDGQVMFHAPYFVGKNQAGVRDVNCDVGENALAELRAYYQEMTDAETGERLFERTMWYCSAEDGWVVKGGSAAELYGIATEK